MTLIFNNGDPVRVGLAAWIVQDGNYADFGVGERRAFALEFWPATPLSIRDSRAGLRPCSMTWLRDATYAVEGTVGFVGSDWWVLDAGLPMYQEGSPPSTEIGAYVHGEVSVHVDHFSYFERHAGAPGAPALIYDWRIEDIEIDTTPWVEVRPRYFERDPTRRGSKPVTKTKAWEDDGGHAGYVLSCRRLANPPRFSLRE